jgi:hypothetical protein
MMINVTEEIDFVRVNIDKLAAMANGQYIDPLVRPKSKRVQWTDKTYKKPILDGIEWWQEQPENMQQKFLNGVGGFAQQALNYEFWPQRLRWIYSVLTSRPDLKKVADELEHAQKMRALRDAERDMNPFDANIHCWSCGKFMHEYDEKNNKRHDKDEVCICRSSHTIQNKMRERIKAYRAHLKMREKERRHKTK